MDLSNVTRRPSVWRGGGQGPRNFRQIVRVDWYCFIPYLSKGRRDVTCSEYRSVRCRMRFEA